ncbi:monovalent cation/H(+) antiporter subunit G [Streptomyces sp. NPDC086787]|uniref:monovalent cation/H(+) antiporter subunit G n=1 Tax=Streptomyces sp. NPDC086787 TaxID=3365759 RepID=UPI0038081017
MRHIVVLVLLWAGVACMVLSAVAVVRLRDTVLRLHGLAPASCAGVPLVAAAVAVEQGVSRAAVKTLLIGLLFAAGGTVTTIAVARASAQAEEDIGESTGEGAGGSAGKGVEW